MNPVLIGFAGGIGVGKSTICNALRKTTLNSEIYNFADPLYSILNKFDPGIFQGMSQEEKLMPFTLKPEWTRRQALQYVGTDIIRDQLSPDAWTTAFDVYFNSVKKYLEAVFVGDVRFPNEVAKIKAHGGMMVWLNRKQATQTTEHISDNILSPVDCDVIIDNSFDIDKTVHDIGRAYLAFIHESER